MSEFESKPALSSSENSSGGTTSSLLETVLPWAMPHGFGGPPPDGSPTGDSHSTFGVSELFGNYADHEGPPKPQVLDKNKAGKGAPAQGGKQAHSSKGALPKQKAKANDNKAADSALKEAGKLLDPKAKHDDAGKDATAAMQVLNKLPPAQQKAAMAKMGAEDFQRLITNVPKENREQFETLFRNCADPERKLQLWGEFHKSKVQNDVKRKHEDSGLIDDAIYAMTGFKTQDRAEVDRKNSEREDIAKTTDVEVDEEMKHLRDQMKAGKKVTAQDVEKLAERKGLEYGIEAKHLVNITNDVDNPGTPNAGTTKPTERATWSKQELLQVASGLDRLPSEATTDNPMLKEIRRSKMYKEFDSATSTWVKDPDVGGDHGNGVIQMYDTGVTGSYRHTGQTSELAGHSAKGKGANGKISPLEESLVHEVGHDIHDLHPEAMDKLKNTTGWADVADKNALKAKLVATGMSEADATAKVAEVEGQRANNYGAEGVTVDGVTYKVDPYSSDGYLSHKQGAIPKGQEWDYARTNYKDHFAEMYSAAIHAPEHLHRDLIEGPKKNVDSKQQAQQKLADQLKTLRESGKADPTRITMLEEKLKTAQSNLDQAKREEQMYGEQWHIMREDVFHLDDAKIDASAKSLEGHVPKGKEKKAAKLQEEFKKKAEKAATPAQVEELEKQYQKRVESL